MDTDLKARFIVAPISVTTKASVAFVMAMSIFTTTLPDLCVKEAKTENVANNNALPLS